MMLRSNYTIWHFMLEDWTVWGLSDSFKTEMWQIVSLEATSLWLAQPKNVKLRWMIQHKNSSIKLGAKLLSSTHWCFSRENFFKCGSQKFAIITKGSVCHCFPYTVTFNRLLSIFIDDASTYISANVIVTLLTYKTKNDLTKHLCTVYFSLQYLLEKSVKI